METQDKRAELVRAITARHTALCRELVALGTGKSPEAISAAAFSRAVGEFEAELADYPDLRQVYERDLALAVLEAMPGQEVTE